MLRVPVAGPDLCQDLTRDAFAQLMERRPWSWLMRTNSIYPLTFPTPGTIATANGSTVLTGTGTAFGSESIGAQIRVGGLSYPTYTVLQVISPTSVMLDRPWMGPALTGQGYTLAQVYFTMPSDFDFLYSVVNPTGNYQLNVNATQAELDAYDPQRSQFGMAFALAYLDTTRNYAGQVQLALQVHGTGPAPVSGSSTGYSYPLDSVYTVEIATGGVSGTATFNWKQDSGITSGSGIATSLSPITLSNGVQVSFPSGTYVQGDVFVILCKADTTSGLPRYEMWPRPVGAPYTYSFTYVAKLLPLSDEQPQLPSRIARRGDVLLETVLTNLALWPGTPDAPNPYCNNQTAAAHRATAEKMIYELERQDDELAMKDLTYTYSYAGPWRDGSWLQTHAVY